MAENFIKLMLNIKLNNSYKPVKEYWIKESDISCIVEREAIVKNNVIIHDELTEITEFHIRSAIDVKFIKVFLYSELTPEALIIEIKKQRS